MDQLRRNGAECVTKYKLSNRNSISKKEKTLTKAINTKYFMKLKLNKN